MTWTLSETFDDPRGRWNQWAPFDSTLWSNANEAFLTTQEHVDIRNFREFTDLIPVPQDPDLDQSTNDPMIAVPQTALELKPGLTLYTEAWVKTGTGTGAITVGKMGSHFGWSGLQCVTNGSNLATFLESSLPAVPSDISAMDDVAVIFPNYNSFDALDSYIMFTSDPNGTFGTGHDSAQVLFNDNISIMPQLLIPVASFANAGFDNRSITGVRLYLAKLGAPAAQTITVMALRAFKSTWAESWLDFDTRLGAVCITPTLDATAYIGTIAEEFEFVRGDGTQNDPIPIDGAYNVYFTAGGEVGAQAIDPLTNRLSLLLRERKNIPDDLGSYVQISLSWNDVGTVFDAKRVDITGGIKTETGLHSNSVGGPLDPTKHYLWRVEIKGTNVTSTIFDTQIDGTLVSTVWFLPVTITDLAYATETGRFGFVAAFVDRDAYLSAITVAPTGYAVLRTKVYNSRTPVDGAQLAAVFSSDVNLFQSVTGSDLLVDQTKTLSGDGSFRTSKAITTNQFLVDDWTQTYLDLAIWVPNSVSILNQPQIYLNDDTTIYRVTVPKLQPAQWNLLHFDLGLYRNLLSGVSYSVTVRANPSPNKPLGNFWVDNIVIGRRRVAWSIRATVDGPFRRFGDAVNNPTGAVHFNSAERGRVLELKAEALTLDAWVSSFKLFPRYAELGLPVYDQGFETR